MERIDTSASESNVDLAQPSNACQKAKVSVGTVVQEERAMICDQNTHVSHVCSEGEALRVNSSAFFG